MKANGIGLWNYIVLGENFSPVGSPISELWRSRTAFW